MKDRARSALSRRGFLVAAGAGATGLALGLHQLGCRRRDPNERVGPPLPERIQVAPVAYHDFTDVYRQRWTWDRVAKGNPHPRQLHCRRAPGTST